MKDYIGGFQPDLMPVGTPVAILRFGESNIPQDYQWTTFSTANEYKSAISSLKYGNGETYTKDGIKKALSLFQQRQGNGHGKVLMLITDGEPNPANQSPCSDEILSELTRMQVTVIILGIGNFDVRKIQCVTSSSQYVIHSQFDSLATIRDKMHQLYCLGPQIQCPRKEKADTVLLVDDSGSIKLDWCV
eukprot:UN28008